MLLMLVKALYSLLLPPASFALLFAAIALWMNFRTGHKRMAAVLAAGTALFWISATPLAGSLLTRSLESRYEPPIAGTFKADAIVMLTGGATLDTPNMDGSLGHAQSDTAGRLLTAARLQRQTNLPLIVSGGQVFTETGNEGDVSFKELQGLGIPAGRILLERTSRNTQMNAANSAAILRQMGWSQPLLVTSAVHMPRSVAEFHRIGVDVIPFPTDYKVNASFKPTLLSFIPSSRGLELTAGAMKEMLGLLAVRLRTQGQTSASLP